MASTDPSLPGSGYLLGDAEYDSNALYDLAHQADHQLLAPKRQKHRGVGHRPQSPHRLRSIELMKRPFGKRLHGFRRQIEREFGTLTNFGGGLAGLPRLGIALSTRSQLGPRQVAGQHCSLVPKSSRDAGR
jgi:hypothetical protein